MHLIPLDLTLLRLRGIGSGGHDLKNDDTIVEYFHS